MIYRLTFIVLFLLNAVSLCVMAFPSASPAGGNYLVLDDVDDYAVLDFDAFGFLFPKGTDEFTVEAWVYPTTAPDKRTTASILSQQVRMRVWSDDHVSAQSLKKSIEWQRGDLLLITDAHVAGWGGGAVTPFFPITISPNRWHHIAYQAEREETITIVNDLAKILPQGTTLGHDLTKFWRPKDFTLGGFGEKIEIPHVANQFWGSFTGYVDAVRISDVARYDVNKKGFTPKNKFRNDARTIALWHFDEPGGTRTFKDSSDNGYHLIGKGGAKTGLPRSVEAAGKLTTVWGHLKQ